MLTVGYWLITEASIVLQLKKHTGEEAWFSWIADQMFGSFSTCKVFSPIVSTVKFPCMGSQPALWYP